MAAGFIAETGDITRFDDAKELQKLAGMELVADSSGKHNNPGYGQADEGSEDPPQGDDPVGHER